MDGILIVIILPPFRENKEYQDMVYQDLRYCVYGVNSVVNSVIYSIVSTL